MPSGATASLVASPAVEVAEPGVYRGPNVNAEYGRILGRQLRAKP